MSIKRIKLLQYVPSLMCFMENESLKEANGPTSLISSDATSILQTFSTDWLSMDLWKIKRLETRV